MTGDVSGLYVVKMGWARIINEPDQSTAHLQPKPIGDAPLEGQQWGRLRIFHLSRQYRQRKSRLILRWYPDSVHKVHKAVLPPF